jgi:hypothetical protein
MSENSAIQINWKTKRDGMLINLRANSAEELDVLLDGITLRLPALIDLEQTTETISGTAKAVETVQNVFPNAQVVANAPAPVSAPAPGYAPQTAPQNTTAPQCVCGGGEMRFISAGISKTTGKPYRAFYACPKPQAVACKHRLNA